MKALKILSSILLTSCFLVFCASAAWADGCDSLDKNKTWTEKINVLAEAVQHQDFAQGKAVSQDLEAICPQSPMLNYLLGMMYSDAGDTHKATYYITKATMHTNEFDIPQDMLERFWFARYEIEHPEATELVKTKDDDRAAFQKLMQEANFAKTSLSAEQDSRIKWYKNMMWTGAGIGITGIALTIIGGVMVGISQDNSVTRDDEKFKPTHALKASYAVLGIGLGATVSGAIMTGIAGYKYVKERDSASFALNISYDYIGLSVQF